MATSTSSKAKATGARTPSDRQAAKPAAKKVRNVRVLPGEVRLDWDGEEYVLEPDVIDDVDLILALEQNRRMSALVILLGNEQWERFRATQRDGTRVRASDASEFMEALLSELQKVAQSGN